MICPFGEECRTHLCSSFQCLKPKPKECSDFNLFTSPPPPTLAEIERLVDALETTCIEYGATPTQLPRVERESQAKMNAARAALMAAIRRHIQE